MSAAFQSIAPGDSFEFDPDCVLDGNHGSRLEFESRVGRAELVNGQRIVAVHQHVPTPFAHSHYEQLDLEAGGRLPLTEHLKYPLLGILVLRRRTCGRSNQLIMYFIAIFLLCGSSERLLFGRANVRIQRARASSIQAWP